MVEESLYSWGGGHITLWPSFCHLLQIQKGLYLFLAERKERKFCAVQLRVIFAPAPEINTLREGRVFNDPINS
jgi:hypothetical protein